MSREIISAITLVMLMPMTVAGADTMADTSLELLFEGAEERFQPPSHEWFEQSQGALQEEVKRVSQLLEAEGEDYAHAWKTHLRWQLIEGNLGALNEVNLEELELARRWFYSNRPGLELELFAQIRQRLDTYLDAVFTLQRPNLAEEFKEKVALVRRQCRVIDGDPTDRQVLELVRLELVRLELVRLELVRLELVRLELGRTLGWFERTRQLADEVALVRGRVSLSNAQLIVSSSLIDRLTDRLGVEVTESMPVVDTLQVPSGRRGQRVRTLKLSGEASSSGQVSVRLAPNNDVLEFLLGFDGRVHANCRAITGPVALTLVTSGTVEAFKSVFLDAGGMRLGETTVIPRVSGRVTDVDGRSNFAERLGNRRTNQPDMQAMTNRNARQTTHERMQKAFDERVGLALRQMQANANRTLHSPGRIAELLAPVAREGAQPVVDSISSPDSRIEVKVTSARRSQLAARLPCPSHIMGADVQACAHVSFFNNTAETMLGGKRLSDEFCMKYAEALHAELPLPLTVHERTERWALLASKLRPIELQIVGQNVLQFRLSFESLEVDGREYAGKSRCTIDYRLTRDEVGASFLQRLGEVRLESELSEQQAEFLRTKVDAFLSPTLDGSGIAVPDGEAWGMVNQIESVGIVAIEGWIIAGWNVPDSILDALVPPR